MQGGFAAIDSALSEVDRKKVRGIGISGQQHGFVPMDGDGQVSFQWHAALYVLGYTLGLLQICRPSNQAAYLGHAKTDKCKNLDSPQCC